MSIRILLCSVLASLCLWSGSGAAQNALGIPASERAALLDLYNSTNGANWTVRTNWNGGPGTECTWYGVTCNASRSSVNLVVLPANNLAGPLPSSFNALTNLHVFDADDNHLTGTIPSLAGLTSLTIFRVSGNLLTGAIPALAGLTNLGFFEVYDNQLSGAIPALAGLAHLEYFLAQRNRLTGQIPPLTSMPALFGFDVGDNQLTGPIPPLVGLTNLAHFRVSNNRMTGRLPALPGLVRTFEVAGNQFVGEVPAVADPNRLAAAESSLCPNFLSRIPDAVWDAATGHTPWYDNCGIAPQAGLWWNPAESGSGYALDFKHGVLVVTLYSYTQAGPPIWYLASGPVINNAFTATLDKYAGGQCISCAYRPNSPNGNDGVVSIFFTSSTSATMTLPGGRNIPIMPQDF